MAEYLVNMNVNLYMMINADSESQAKTVSQEYIKEILQDSADVVKTQSVATEAHDEDVMEWPLQIFEA